MLNGSFSNRATTALGRQRPATTQNRMSLTSALRPLVFRFPTTYCTNQHVSEMWLKLGFLPQNANSRKIETASILLEISAGGTRPRGNLPRYRLGSWLSRLCRPRPRPSSVLNPFYTDTRQHQHQNIEYETLPGISHGTCRRHADRASDGAEFYTG